MQAVRKMRWTNMELETLRSLIGKVPLREIAQWLDRSEQAVRSKAWQEQLKFSDKGASQFDCVL